MRSIRIERVYRYPRLMVWKAIANREALADWLMPNDFEPVQGHEFTFRTKPAREHPPARWIPVGAKKRMRKQEE